MSFGILASQGAGAGGDTGNGVLQTGSVTGNISALWEHNWFAGGHYTIRGAGNDPQVGYILQRQSLPALRH